MDRGPNIVMEAAAVRMRAGCEGGGKGALVQVEKSGTLGCANDQAIFTVSAFKAGQGAAARSIGYAEEVSPTLTAAESGGNLTPCVVSTVVSQQKFGEYKEGVGTLTANNGTRHTGETLVVAGLDCRNAKENPELCATLQCGAHQGFSYNCIHPVRIGKTVRRLTPLECERLQGYPDGWTDIGDWVKTSKRGKQITVKSADSLRYKALGNSIALPPWRWVLMRISALYERPATLGSLFDGIGGFPLLWERFNGAGSCLWASEIEPFPIAVTKYHFCKEATP